MQPGRTIYASGASWQDRQFEGVVRAVGSRVDPVTRAVVVRAIIPNEDRALRPGMLLTVRILAEERTAIVVPERSVVQVGNSSFVYVVGANQRVNRQEVQLGTRQLGVVEVVAGLEEGEQIVTDGIIKLREGMLVKVAGDGAEQRVAEQRSDELRDAATQSDSAAPTETGDAPARSN